MTSPADRLIEIAQRLDELAGDDASELQTLSSELGEIAEKWPQKPALTEGGMQGSKDAERALHLLQKFVRELHHEGFRYVDRIDDPLYYHKMLDASIAYPPVLGI